MTDILNTPPLRDEVTSHTGGAVNAPWEEFFTSVYESITDLATPPMRTVEESATITASDVKVIFDITANATCTLPDPTTNLGKSFKIFAHYSNSSYTVSFSETINGSSITLSAGESKVIESNGVEYIA